MVSVEVIPASAEQEPILANLVELYIYDFSEFLDVNLRENGRFGYDRLSSYWIDPTRYPFLVRVDGDLAGFVLVQRGSQISGESNIWDMAEFFVVRSFRRSGVGMRVAHTIWSMFRGQWEVRVIGRNERAKEFWPRAIEQFLGRPIIPIRFEKNGQGWQLFRFESEADLS